MKNVEPCCACFGIRKIDINSFVVRASSFTGSSLFGALRARPLCNRLVIATVMSLDSEMNQLRMLKQACSVDRG